MVVFYLHKTFGIIIWYVFSRKEAQRCYCGASNCRGFIGGEKTQPLKQLPDSKSASVSLSASSKKKKEESKKKHDYNFSDDMVGCLPDLLLALDQ